MYSSPPFDRRGRRRDIRTRKRSDIRARETYGPSQQPPIFILQTMGEAEQRYTDTKMTCDLNYLGQMFVRFATMC
jgi:hypothetical protein